MRSLQSVLVCEGRTDEWLLPVLLQRATHAICLETFPGDVEVRDVRVLRADHQIPAEIVAAVLRERGAFDVLLYHHDGAPRRTAEQKIAEVRAALDKAGVTEDCVSVVPVRETEVWILADPRTLAMALSVPEDRVRALVPAQATQAEGVPDPKAVLGQVMRSLVRRHRRVRPDGDDVERYFSEIAENLNIPLLREVPAFGDWWNEMVRALDRLGFRYG
ncbi:hypothetical protein C1I98_04920 [Spongiactinospora gelatinilytica]|uniref:DUF4276 family protein n=1 Tax=Spongiactinospora gelatinilytica TaxID=2666298 RepID=A0A2W2I7P0_9ACTN|nr:DUF4276 family protein [Spongiactinospora gelatinilytica]PZG54117.1 hypothetical protein C1I98_04920 [Spongiactinospora gelatinilytica]